MRSSTTNDKQEIPILITHSNQAVLSFPTVFRFRCKKTQHVQDWRETLLNMNYNVSVLCFQVAQNGSSDRKLIQGEDNSTYLASNFHHNSDRFHSPKNVTS